LNVGDEMKNVYEFLAAKIYNILKIHHVYK